MNNKQKFQQTVLKVQEIRKKYGEPLEEKIPAEDNLEKKIKLLEVRRMILGLDFQETKPDIAFGSQTYSIFYQPMKLNRKLRVRAVPICFCVTLYELEMQAEFSKEDIQIPYDLRGFWKMKQAIQLMEDFVNLQNNLQEILLWEYRRLKNQEKAKAAEYFKILEEFVSMGTMNSGWKKEITYHDLRFVMKTENTKLDVVPLCKILTKYYANVVAKINRYLKTSASKAEEDKLEDIKGHFTAFMEMYFINMV